MKRIRSESIAISELVTWKKAEELLPEYSEKQYMDLIEFVQNGGQIPPVVISEQKQVIDGYNRWRLAKRLEIDQVECDVYSYDNEDEMELHAIVLNAKRRHLNKLQVARAAVRLSTLINPPEEEEAEEPAETETEVTPEETPTPETADMLEEPKPEEAAPTPTPEPEPEPEENEASFDQVKAFNRKIQAASHKLGVPQSLIKQVKKIDETNDDILIHAMEEKQITIKKAAEIAELPEEERAQAIMDECEKASDETQKRVTAVVSSCTSFVRKIKACKKNLVLDGLPENDIVTVRESITEMLDEAQDLLNLLNQPSPASAPTPAVDPVPAAAPAPEVPTAE